MKIYVSHSRSFDFVNELYLPIRKSALNEKHTFFLPHENGRSLNSKEDIKNSDLILAEVSFPSTGQGIELGWADSCTVPIVCIYKDGCDFSPSLKSIIKDFVTYNDSNDFISKLEELLVSMN
ncbi:MAG: hypothetical protein A3C79_02630 [Candidatus Taylorbacteria bacterium RIFCSPHIGHO2_02_FULL_45_28]|uniref:Nucleoside 2-deoxyribosyltransferase n=1 Tax=Candidatus Taylorbacteria bacterium RIFCSPHIGHO2_12_FULL_45_16 TaxID=1802315 RepID=A0A1G2N083_9BACT|nr:MAG: hypothetical protein A2830_03435 [Candidatus Taylorbacteria bacterium RIFCSPHIGHO2_01_FULL_44_110]OHA25345.1 MAG: hypothetical protein A3C79_02630 [Candidatus Taylorbacteria bacterium RIFCSPHIGHO2_02_FULL_45_28]OHA28732.1 MAG: hypothetical protein A3F51_03095 [Candidatus Taylorbacteria bacterium RIFCSPHIGHO2_12_FULL_45_16]OHA33005.1 MAG: hypothetical protein A3A23_01275 [Candidatus Taylorbacteria bacterium RIFCSPLOWO2_01_FULL_45_59]OHA39674.1 MAG: hypothetical protein A3I98_00995 [Candi